MVSTISATSHAPSVCCFIFLLAFSFAVHLVVSQQSHSDLKKCEYKQKKKILDNAWICHI